MAKSIDELYRRWRRTGLKDDWEAVGAEAAKIANVRASARSAGRNNSHDYESYLSAALLGAAKALDRYDENAGASLASFVYWYADHEIKRHVRDAADIVRTPARLYEAGWKFPNVLRYDAPNSEGEPFEENFPNPACNDSWYDESQWERVLEALSIVRNGGRWARAAKPLRVGYNQMSSIFPKLERYLNNEAEDPYSFDFEHYLRVRGG